MKRKSISKHLRAQRIASRRSTFSNAFASALADFERFDDVAVAKAIQDLGQDPDADLECVYCGAAAATWDHVFPRVIGGEFSGHGHSIRNLVPCCRRCSEKKGGKDWRVWIEKIAPRDIAERVGRIERFLASKSASNTALNHIRESAPDELARFQAIRQEVFKLLEEADLVADKIRYLVTDATSKSKSV